MADRPVITTIPSGGVYDTDTLNDNFTKLRDEFDNLLSRKGTAAANNSIDGDIDFAGNGARNLGIIAPIGGPTETVGTIEQLRISTDPEGSIVQVLGYYAAGDGGGGLFYLDAADTTSPDDGAIVVVDASNNRWKRRDKETISNVRCWGARGDGVTNDNAAVMACITYHEGIGGGDVYFPLGDYPVAIQIATGNLVIKCEPGTILRAASASSVFDVLDTVTGPTTLIDADIRGQEKAQEGVPRPVGSPGAGYENCRALHCVRVMGPDVTIIRCKAKGARYDGLYGRVRPTTNNGIANFRSIDSDWGDVGRNTISLVDGHYWYFDGGSVWNEGRYWEAGEGTHTLYLFDIEPTSSESCTHVYIRNFKFLAGSPVSGSHQFIPGTPQTADNISYVYIDNCYFGQYGTGGISNSTIRTKGDVSGAETRGLYISNSTFESHIIANVSTSDLKDCHISNCVVGTSVFDTWFNDGCSITNVIRRNGEALTLPIRAGANVVVRNCTGYIDRVPATRVFGDETLTGGVDATTGLQTATDTSVTAAGYVAFTKQGDGTIGTDVPQLTITPLGQTAIYCEVVITSQAIGTTVARISRFTKQAFMVTRAGSGAPVVDMIADATIDDTLSSNPGVGNREPGALNPTVTVVGETVVVAIDNSVNVGSQPLAVSVSVQAHGRRALRSIFS